VLLTGAAGFLAYQYFKPNVSQQAFGSSDKSPSIILVERLEAAFEFCPTFFRGALTDAVQEAKNQNRMIMVFIHEPQNENPHDVSSNPFCRDVLCTQFVSEVLSTNFICWAGVAHTRDTTNLIRVLQVTHLY
jgi:hypothetical protein